MDRLKWNERAVKEEFYAGLNPEICDRLANITNKPKELRTFVTLCIDIHNELNHNRGHQTKYNLYAFATRSHTWHPPRPQPQHWAALRNQNGTYTSAAASVPTLELPPKDPMDLETSRKPKFICIPDAEPTPRRENRLCLYCNIPNHYAVNCSERGHENQEHPPLCPARIAAAAFEEGDEEPGKDKDQKEKVTNSWAENHPTKLRLHHDTTPLKTSPKVI